jgi:hypothetical protein
VSRSAAESPRGGRGTVDRRYDARTFTMLR